ncbi:putative rhamnose kinase [Saccharopolyspora erythraea NRRL 2338]|uniref:Rhamnose kinase n=1 Tax=Saccharopolyspora erythraea (strain ATCC 11635 / DSM 40517 / JCM 4748 / NBRC 13426 / NCIMB 8594 / NRRL 2338) TaxID=405948 RepID=A4FH48_SACEN|nr:putative rhamnose kinase [Saccharopolyspora erythraea NRRL 2338]
MDLGASSGRVIVGRFGAGELDLHEVHRFANNPVRLADGLHWDVLGLYREVLGGLRLAQPHALASVGIDGWAVDFGLLDGDGVLLGNPYHYRDERGVRGAEAVRARVDDAEHYRICGLQRLPINTVYQLAAAARSAHWDRAETLLLVPDLLVYWLTGEVGAEITNASTTGLFDATSRSWSRPLLDRLGLPSRLFPALRAPGEPAGHVRDGVASEAGVAGGLPVTVVASHDTASAVAAVPASADRFAYVSCGTWSPAGLELDGPVLTEESRAANFTNELGVDGTVRYLRNTMGLWLLHECVRSWRRQGRVVDEPQLLAQAAEAAPFAALVDATAPALLAPADMPSAIAEQCARTGQRPPADPAAVTRCVLESLAMAHRATLREAARLSGRGFDVVHLVGGGSRIELLCQLTADACGVPVVAGPTEATALGNLLVQARASGAVADLAAGRRLVARTQRLRHYRPRGGESEWASAAARVGLG